MPSLWLSKYSRWIEALLNAKGGPAIVDVDPSMRVVALIQEGNEDRYLQGWNRFGANASVTGVAANFAQAQLRNPANSNVIAVIESLTAETFAAVTDTPSLTWGATVSDLATIVSLTFSRFDPRGQPQPTCILSSTAGGANLAIFQQFSQPANSIVNFVTSVNTEFPVLPGQIVKVFSGTANQSQNFGFIWRERALQQSELT